MGIVLLASPTATVCCEKRMRIVLPIRQAHAYVTTYLLLLYEVTGGSHHCLFEVCVATADKQYSTSPCSQGNLSLSGGTNNDMTL